MSERNPFALLTYDTLQGEYFDDESIETFPTLSEAEFVAGMLHDEIFKEHERFGSSAEDEKIPYSMYIVGPDGSRTLAW